MKKRTYAITRLVEDMRKQNDKFQQTLNSMEDVIDNESLEVDPKRMEEARRTVEFMGQTADQIEELVVDWSKGGKFREE